MEIFEPGKRAALNPVRSRKDRRAAIPPFTLRAQRQICLRSWVALEFEIAFYSPTLANRTANWYYSLGFPNFAPTNHYVNQG